MEHWVEVNLFGPMGSQNEVLLRTLIPYIRRLQKKGVLVSFHYFREPEIRFRVRLTTAREKARQDEGVARMARSLVKKRLIDSWKFGNHGEAGKYVGEEDRYGKEGWKVAQKYFQRGSETALALIALKERGSLENPLWGEGLGNPWEGGKKNPWRDVQGGPLEFHWSRFVHLFSNQLGFDMLKEASLNERQAERYRRVEKEFGMKW